MNDNIVYYYDASQADVETVEADLAAINEALSRILVMSETDRRVIDVVLYAATMLGAEVYRAGEHGLTNQEVVHTMTHAFHDRENGAGLALRGIEEALMSTGKAAAGWLASKTGG